MVSDVFRQLEDSTGKSQILQSDLVSELAFKTGKEKAVIERVLYLACVAIGRTPVDMDLCVNEFLTCLDEETRLKQDER